MLQFTDYQAFKAYLFLHQDIKDKNEAHKVIQDLENEKSNWHKAHTISKADDVYPQIFLTIADAYFKIGYYDKSIDYLKQAVDFLENDRDYKYYYEFRECAYRMLARNYCYKNEVDLALMYMKDSAFNNLKLFTNTHYDGYEFYSFRGVSDYSLKDLKDETLSLSDPADFNDPVDSPFFPWLDLKIKELQEQRKYKDELFYNVMYEAYSNVRARCFVRKSHLPDKEKDEEQDEVRNTLMWAHYTDYHKGFCVKYKFPSSLTWNNEPDKILNIAEIHYVDSLRYNRDLTFNEAFFTKSKFWEYENEKRLFYFDRKGSPKHVTIPLPEQSIIAVYIGLRCSDENKYKIRLALENKPWIKLYQMELSRNDIFSIVPVEIKKEDIRPVKITRNSCCCESLKLIKKKIKSLF